MPANAGPMKSPPSSDWPAQADHDYDRIRVLGAGAFGEVWLARSKQPGEDGKIAHVAIKGVSIQNENEGATAAREMAILSEMNHPNIIKLLHSYKPASPSAKGIFMALSYVQGPDLGELLEARGAVGLQLAQLIARDLVSAVAYCHVRGVMHRDIKPDNVLLAGCMEGKKWLDDESMWDDKEGKFPQGRFKAVLADFGFARAASAADFEQVEEDEEKKEDDKRAMFDRRKSRYVFRANSAVGTKHFAAPEICTNVRHKSASERALTSCVSSYGLISDAYAVGATLNEITTGVPPGEENEAYVKANRVIKAPKKQNSLARLKGKILSRRFSAPDSTTYEINLRCFHDLPEPACDLIQLLMKEDMDERMSVREAQSHEWIGGYDSIRLGDVPSHPDDPILHLEKEAAFI